MCLGQCLNNNGKGEKCYTENCGAVVFMKNDGSMGVIPFCATDDDVKAVGLWFNMRFDIKFQRYFGWDYTFRCHYDNCNNGTILSSVITKFHAEYDILSIAKVFGYRNQDEGENEETTAASTKSSTSTTDSVKSSTSTTDSVKSSTSTTDSVKSSAIPSPVTNSYNNTTPTNIAGTTTKSSHAMQPESHNTLIYTAFIIIHSHLLFLV
jgi:hypothetical protein